MKPLYTKTDFKIAKSNDKLPCECYNCGSIFYTTKKLIASNLKLNKQSCKFCNLKCYQEFKKKQGHTLVNCVHCKQSFLKANAQIKKYSNHFCSQSCATTFNNTHKVHGTRRSKLEQYLEEQLVFIYPELSIDFNKKNAINSELDIYIPSLNLAFELNGIYHYEPIHGQDKLNQIQNNDHRKFQACSEAGISLYIIDTSKQKYFKKETAEKFLKIITNIIKQQ